MEKAITTVEYSEAARVSKEALKVAEVRFSPNHSDGATFFMNLTGLYNAHSKYAKAESFVKDPLR